MGACCGGIWERVAALSKHEQRSYVSDRIWDSFDRIWDSFDRICGSFDRIWGS